jgi:chromosome segregation ATPase
MSVKIDDLKHAISAFVAQVEGITTAIEDEIAIREQKAEGLLKQAAVIQESKNKLLEDQKKLSSELAALEKDKEAARDRKMVLDQREKELQAKSEKIQRILNAV